jgi:acetolactate synthase-1/2/3 large subunit
MQRVNAPALGAVEPGSQGTIADTDSRENADQLVEAMARGGIEHLFFASGSDILPLQEAVCKARAQRRPTPELITVLHETVGVNAAMGSAMVSGAPSAVAVHVDSGALNIGGGWHTAAAGGYPILILAGSPPRGYPGTNRGSRDHPIYWLQEYTDQRVIAEPWAKWSLRLDLQDNAGLVVSRALQVALASPPGPAFLTVPREVAMAPAGHTAFPTVTDLGLPTPAAPDPAAIDRLAGWLLAAERPLIVTGRSGKDPGAVAALVRVAELVGAPITSNGMRDRLNFPADHALYESGPSVSEADFVLILDKRVPWVPAPHQSDEVAKELPLDRSATHIADPSRAPREGCRVVWLGEDPAISEIPVLEITADLRIAADPNLGLRALAAAIEDRSDDVTRKRTQTRLQAARRRKAELVDAFESAAMAASSAQPIDPRWLARNLARVLDNEAILLDDGVSNAHVLRRYCRQSRPHSYFSAGSATGGWGAGAAIGAKLAAPERDVVLFSGDGFYAYGVPSAALWTAIHHGTPYLAVVAVNGRYSTGTSQLLDFYPDGHAEAAGFPGGRLEPPPDFAAEAQATGAYGERVTRPDEVEASLRRGLDAARSGTPAVIAVVTS